MDCFPPQAASLFTRTRVLTAGRREPIIMPTLHHQTAYPFRRSTNISIQYLYTDTKEMTTSRCGQFFYIPCWTLLRLGSFYEYSEKTSPVLKEPSSRWDYHKHGTVQLRAPSDEMVTQLTEGLQMSRRMADFPF